MFYSSSLVRETPVQAIMEQERTLTKHILTNQIGGPALFYKGQFTLH